jgi:septal ring factor EnvC (AmiA/AmiB activator)
MAERFTADLAFIIIALAGAAALGLLIGYYVRKSMKCKRCAELENENASLRQMINSLETDKQSMKHRIEKLEADLKEATAKITKRATTPRTGARKKKTI